jgi:thiamine-monophosphate kinase
VAIGEQQPEKMVYRNTAKEGDLLCVTGDLGAAYMGLKILQREKEVFLNAPGAEIQLDKHTYIVERQLKPEVRKDIIEYLAERKVVPTSMIDISDGLSSEILHICKQSGVGCQLEEEAVPIANETYDTALSLQIDPINCALSGGEYFELLFSIDPKDKTAIDQHHDISIIGEITDSSRGAKLHTKGDNYYDLLSLGWDNMRDA